MKLLDLTLPTPHQNLACDEALLDECEEGLHQEILRFWESPEYFVVLGYSNKIAREINELSCRESGIPVLRRCSGGGTVLQGPGCLNYSLILKIEDFGPLSSITRTNAFVIEKNASALASALRLPVRMRGTSDLAVGDLKFSGNAQRRKRRYLLFHGTFLYNFKIDLIEKFLPLPSQQPDYRNSRSHRDFLANLDAPALKIKEAIKKSWAANETYDKVPGDEIDALIKEKYSKKGWNEKL